MTTASVAAVSAVLASLAVLVLPFGRSLGPRSAVLRPVDSVDPSGRRHSRDRRGDRLRRALGGLGGGAGDSVDGQVATLVGLVAPGLAAGLDPWRAWTAAVRASPGPVSEAIGQALSEHGGVSVALRAGPTHEQSALLRRVVEMIELGEQLGTPLGGVLERAVQTFQAEEGARAAVEAAAAGARSTGRLLLGLTVAGPVIAAVLGLDVLDVYLGRPWVAAAAVLGVVLALAGRWWLGLLSAAAARPRRWE